MTTNPVPTNAAIGALNEAAQTMKGEPKRPGRIPDLAKVREVVADTAERCDGVPDRLSGGGTAAAEIAARVANGEISAVDLETLGKIAKAAQGVGVGNRIDGVIRRDLPPGGKRPILGGD